MKKLFVILAMVAALAFAPVAMAKNGGDGGNGGNQNRCHNIAGLVIDCSETTNVDNSISNRAVSNSNSSATAGAIGINIIDVDNEIDQDQKQAQKQEMGQKQKMGQEQSANNEGVTQDTKVVIEGDKYEAAYQHIQGPALVQSDAKFAKGKTFKFRTLGSFWVQGMGLSGPAAYNLGVDADDAKIDRGIAYKYPATKYLVKGIPSEGVYMGNLYVYPDGSKASVAGMEGKGAAMAMKYGATHAVIIYDSGDAADGSAWNIGFGGGASIVADSAGKVLAAPNGGMGFGKAHAINSELPALVIKCYRHAETGEINKK